MGVPSPLQTILGSMTPEDFLRDYWQRQPLLIRQGLPAFENPLSAAEIAGLACEDFIESRLILGSEQRQNWELEHGPVAADRFAELPSTHWTLHVQGLENHFRSIYQLFDYFRFIPNWRIDDIMVSYAPDQGSAGPHFDYYDVFLVQTEGRKVWQLGQPCDSDSALLTGIDLHILEQFEVTQEFVVEPGDVLYIPPGVAHYGIAEGDSITYSVGFRAPGIHDLADEFALYLAGVASADARYRDSGRQLQASPGEISHTECHHIAALLKDQLEAPGNVAAWFGSYMTRPRIEADLLPPEEPLNADEFEAALGQVDMLYWHEGTRVAYSKNDQKVLLFINGEPWTLDESLLEFVRLISSATRIPAATLASIAGQAGLQFLYERYQDGLILLD